MTDERACRRSQEEADKLLRERGWVRDDQGLITRYSHSDGKDSPELKARFDAVCMEADLVNMHVTPAPSGVMSLSGWKPIAAPTPDHMKDWLSPQEYVGGPLVVEHPYPACRDAYQRGAATAGAPIPSDTEAMVDRVVKGVLDGTVSRSQVRTLKGAITGREASDAGSDSLGRAIGAKKP